MVKVVTMHVCFNSLFEHLNLHISLKIHFQKRLRLQIYQWKVFITINWQPPVSSTHNKLCNFRLDSYSDDTILMVMTRCPLFSAQAFDCELHYGYCILEQ